MLDKIDRKVTRQALSHSDFVLVQAIGAEVCAKIKEAYPDKKAYDVAKLFTALKEKMRQFYTHLDEVEMHKELRKYLLADIVEALDCSTKNDRLQGATSVADSNDRSMLVL